MEPRVAGCGLRVAGCFGKMRCWDRQIIGLVVAVRQGARVCRRKTFTEPMAKTAGEGRDNREEVS